MRALLLFDYFFNTRGRLLAHFCKAAIMQHGQRLRKLRINLGLSTNDMARALGLSGEGAADKVRAMERDAREISGPIFELIRYIEKHGLIDEAKKERVNNDGY